MSDLGMIAVQYAGESIYLYARNSVQQLPVFVFYDEI